MSVRTEDRPRLVTVCPWCPPEKRAEVPEGARASHTACPECFERLMAEVDEYEESDDE